MKRRGRQFGAREAPLTRTDVDNITLCLLDIRELLEDIRTLLEEDDDEEADGTDSRA